MEAVNLSNRSELWKNKVKVVKMKFFCTRWKQIPFMWRQLFPWFISLDTQSPRLKKKTRRYTPQNPRYITLHLWAVGNVNTYAKGDVLPVASPFPYFLSYTSRKEDQSCMMLYSPFLAGVPDCSITLVLIPWLSDLGRKLLATLAPFSPSLPAALVDLRLQVAWEKRLGGNNAFAFHHIPSVTSSYHIRSNLCKLVFKSVKISFLNKQHLP